MGIPDIAIAGGGPAGSMASILLARAGARVTLVDFGPQAGWVEGVGQRLVRALGVQGIAIDGLGPIVRRQVDWGVLTGAENWEHTLARPVFDQGLRRQAEAHGVRLITGAIRRVRSGLIELADGGQIKAGLVLEARGRRAPVADGRRLGPAAISIAAQIPCGADGATISARPTGWVWQISANGSAWAQVTVDAASAQSGVEKTWKEMTGHQPSGPMQVRASELRLGAPELDPTLPRLGDAAVAMDPLSGHGLFWAISSALMSVPLAHAIIDGKDDLAARFYRDRVIGTFLRQARIGRDFYRSAGYDGAFWRQRTRWPDDHPAEPAAEDPPYLDRRVIVREGRLAEADVLVTALDPGGAAFVHGVEIAPVLARIGSDTLPGPERFAARILPEAPQATAARIHSWLAERGVTTAPAYRQKEVQA